MATVIGVRFRKAGKIYYFQQGAYSVAVGDSVIVETARGVEYGNVVIGATRLSESEVPTPLRTIIRPATPDDSAILVQNKQKAKEAFNICLEKIAKHGLVMKLIECEYTFDTNKVLFYFTADGRIDFRELVKDLASVFKTRIELRQIGVRDETKIRGGIGICGRALCCYSYLADFAPVSIKMAKEQNLSLNPTKISGVCGRLICCLKNEEDSYEYLNSKLPGIGDHVTTPDGHSGDVASVSVLKQMVRVIVTLDSGDKDIVEYPVSELKFTLRKSRQRHQVDKELRALEQLEKREVNHLDD